MRTWLLAVRTSPARWLFPVALAFETVVLFSFEGAGWRTEWTWAVDWLGGTISLFGPVIAGFATWRAQVMRVSFGEVVAAARGSARAYGFELLGTLSWVWASHLLALAVVSGAVLASGTRGWPPVVALAWQLLALAAYVGVGHAVGLVVKSRLAAPAVAVGSLLAVASSVGGPLPRLWFEAGGATAPLAGLAWRKDVVAAQSVLWLSILVVPWVIVAGGRVRRAAASLAVLVAIVVPAVTLAQTSSDRFELAPSRTAAECHGEAPEVCMHPEAAGRIGVVHDALARISSAAGGTGAGFPARFDQATGAEPATGPGRDLVLSAGTLGVDGVDPVALMHYVVWNRDCLWGDAPPPEAARAVLAELQEVLLVRAGFVDAREVGAGARTMLQASETDQRRWIAQLLTASDRCEFADLRPVGS